MTALWLASLEVTGFWIHLIFAIELGLFDKLPLMDEARPLGFVLVETPSCFVLMYFLRAMGAFLRADVFFALGCGCGFDFPSFDLPFTFALPFCAESFPNFRLVGCLAVTLICSAGIMEDGDGVVSLDVSVMVKDGTMEYGDCVVSSDNSSIVSVETREDGAETG